MIAHVACGRLSVDNCGKRIGHRRPLTHEVSVGGPWQLTLGTRFWSLKVYRVKAPPKSVDIARRPPPPISTASGSSAAAIPEPSRASRTTGPRGQFAGFAQKRRAAQK